MSFFMTWQVTFVLFLVFFSYKIISNSLENGKSFITKHFILSFSVTRLKWEVDDYYSGSR